MSKNGHNQEQLGSLESDGADQVISGVPDRVDAGDGQGEYVYKRRGLFGRLRARFQDLVQTWLANAVPRDENQPPRPGTVTYRLAGTWGRKAATITVAALVGLASVVLVLVGL